MAKEPAEVFSVQSILDSFAELPDPRSTTNRIHLLGDIIVISIAAVIAGADGPRSIGAWATTHLEWLTARLPLPNGVPSHDTIGRVLTMLKPEAFQKCFQAWLMKLSEQNVREDGLKIIAIDGKTLRRSHDRAKSLGPLHMVSAWSVERGISLGQLATEEKSNEITAIPQLIEDINVEDAVVTIDAAGCQKEIAEKIVKAGGDYVLALKGNQKTLYKTVVDYFTKHMENDFAEIEVRAYVEKQKAHGREDEITYYQFAVPQEVTQRKKWSHLNTIGVAIRISNRDGKETSDVRYYMSSLRLSVKKFAACVRGHWSIENALHWCLDVTFREDESRVRERILADNMAWLKRFAISILKQVDDKEGIAMRRRMAGWNQNYLAKVLGIPA